MPNEMPAEASRIFLPPIPQDLADHRVAAWSEPLSIDTYLPELPDQFPAFLESRVYQGSSGRVFPLPFIERVSQTKVAHLWQAVHLENEWLRLVILPELGGRIHIAYDKSAGYDIFYRNNVIKPALVGLAGPWIAGGVEFNWPQHHRPATFLPTDVSIEHEADGSVTVWCSDHDPFARMKGMHGIRLRPDSSKIEARVRLYNRSETRQTFLWWANVAASVSDDYQSFFPRDVNYVADHAKRAVVSFPQARSSYYGVDYPSRVTAEHLDADRLDWYRNIPVPTSYMAMATRGEFFGGYDHGRDVGFVHWASRDISPGKKQWTWGNAPFGWAWDRNLTDGDGPYVELMAGVYTDNQPDFAYLSPGETKSFSQFWYPISKIGPAHEATADVAARLDLIDSGARIGIVASEIISGARVRVSSGDEVIYEVVRDLWPNEPFVYDVTVVNSPALELVLTITMGESTLLRLNSRMQDLATDEPHHAVEPAAPAKVATVDELVQIASYLDQYRHATRMSEPYWQEVLARDPDESRATAALGALLYARADYAGANELLTRSVRRRTEWASTPVDGAAHYLLGLTLVRLGRGREAMDALARASWDAAYSVPARFLLARERSKAGQFDVAVAMLREVVDADRQHLQAADLLAILLRRAGAEAEADAILHETLRRDPLDAWALHLAGEIVTGDATILLDVALEYAAAGLLEEALVTLGEAAGLLPNLAGGQVNVGPIIEFHRAAVLRRVGRASEANDVLDAVSRASARLALPSRLDDVDVLQSALDHGPVNALASALLGHWYYDRRRYNEAIALWERSLDCAPTGQIIAIVHRNLGIASYNVLRDPEASSHHYRLALEDDPGNAKLWCEFDQLCARRGMTSRDRFAQLEKRFDVVSQRDDLTVQYAQLLIDLGRAADAHSVLAGRQFQPWEGGEGQVLAVWERAAHARAHQAMTSGQPHRAIEILLEALHPPITLGEDRHPLANVSELEVALGDALAASGDQLEAEAHWQRAAQSTGDFSQMALARFSSRTYFAIVSLRRLHQDHEADHLSEELRAWVEDFARTPAEVDFFATSLPSMLLFVDPPEVDRDREVATIRAQLFSLRESARA